MAHAHAEREVAASEVTLASGHPFLRVAWGLGALGVVALVAGFALGGERFEASYLVAFLYFWTLAVGGLFFVLLHHLTRAGWSVVVRRLAEHVAGTLPLFILLFLPIVVAAGNLYPWMGGEAAHDELIAGKSAYLNPGFFWLRAALHLVAWSAIAWWFRKRSLTQDETRDPAITRRLQILSAPAMVVFAVTVTFTSFDWIMSLDPHWYSTIFGVYVYAGSTMGIFALLILLALAFERRGPLTGVVTIEHFHDLGKLLFGFVVFWAYIAFSQYMLIWYANIPEETVWYAHRMEHGWGPVTWALALGHFVLPFFYLLSSDVKRHRLPLAIAAVWLLAAHYLDLYWLVMPAVHGAGDVPGGFHPAWTDAAAFAGVGGLFLAAFAWLARRPAMVPVADPRLPESLTFENM